MVIYILMAEVRCILTQKDGGGVDKTEVTYNFAIFFTVSSEGGGGTYEAASMIACAIHLKKWLNTQKKRFRSIPNQETEKKGEKHTTMQHQMIVHDIPMRW